MRVWLDDTNIPAGASIPKRIEDGLRDRQRFGIPMTRNYFASNSGWTEPEWHSALFQDPDNRTRKLLPLLAGECDVPFLLAPHRHPRQDTPSVRRRSNYRSLATRRFEDSCVARRTALRERFPTTSTRHSLAMCLRSRAAPVSSTLRTLPRTYYHAEAPGCRKVASRCCRGRDHADAVATVPPGLSAPCDVCRSAAADSPEHRFSVDPTVSLGSPTLTSATRRLVVALLNATMHAQLDRRRALLASGAARPRADAQCRPQRLTFLTAGGRCTPQLPGSPALRHIRERWPTLRPRPKNRHALVSQPPPRTRAELSLIRPR